MHDISANSIVVAAEHQISCDVDNETALLNLATGVYYGLDPMGAHIWKLLQTPISIADLQQHLSAEYAADPARITTDLHEFLSDMIEAGLVVLREATS